MLYKTDVIVQVLTEIFPELIRLIQTSCNIWKFQGMNILASGHHEMLPTGPSLSAEGVHKHKSNPLHPHSEDEVMAVLIIPCILIACSNEPALSTTANVQVLLDYGQRA